MKVNHVEESFAVMYFKEILFLKAIIFIPDYTKNQLCFYVQELSFAH